MIPDTGFTVSVLTDGSVNRLTEHSPLTGAKDAVWRIDKVSPYSVELADGSITTSTTRVAADLTIVTPAGS